MNKNTKSLDAEMSDSLKRYFDTGLKPSNGWKIAKFPSGGYMNSRSQIEVRKKYLMIRMNQLDGRLGGGYNLQLRKSTSFKAGGGTVYMFYKKYEEVLDTMHALMRMI